jgi:tetratricopeptide (TPR) repeat protein
LKKTFTTLTLFAASALALIAGPVGASPAAENAGAINTWKTAYEQTQELSRQGKSDAALAAAEKALDAANKNFGPEDERVAQTLRAIGQIHLARSNFNQAEIYFNRSLELYKKIKGLNDPETANTMVQAGSLYLGLQRIPEAEEMLRTAFEILRNRLGKDDPRITLSMGGLAEVYKAMGDERAIELFKNVIRILTASRGANDPGVISSYYHLADIYEGLKNYDQAAKCYFTIIRSLEEQYGIHYWQLSSIYNNLGLVYARGGKLAESENAYRHSLDILIRKYGPTHPEAKTVLENINSLYVQKDQATTSQKDLEQP